MNAKRLALWFTVFSCFVASVACTACILVYFRGATGEPAGQAAWAWRAAALWLACVALGASSLRFARWRV